MKIKNYIDMNNITQYYIYNKQNIKKYKFINHLHEYTDLTKNTLFICSSEIDIHFINFHKGKIWLFITESFSFDLYNNISSNIEELLTNSNNIEKIFQNNNKRILNLNSLEIKLINNSLLYVINASIKEKYIERYNLLLKYLENFHSNYLIILCGEETKKENNILYIKCKDCYENLPNKMILAFEWIYKNTLYTHIYKVDDDFFNNTNKINFCDYYGNKEISRINKTYHFGKCENSKLNMKEYTGSYTNPYASGGYGYILSRKSIFILLNNKNYIINELYEDKAIGDVLYKNNIKLQKYNKVKNKKCAVIFYHKNIQKIYKERWYKKTVKTILNQTYKNFDILEINYGGDDYSILDGFNFNNKHHFYKKIKYTY